MGTLGFQQRALLPKHCGQIQFARGIHSTHQPRGMLSAVSPLENKSEDCQVRAWHVQGSDGQGCKALYSLFPIAEELLRGQGSLWWNVWILIHGLLPPQSMYTFDTIGRLVTGWVLMGPFLSFHAFFKNPLKEMWKGLVCKGPFYGSIGCVVIDLSWKHFQGACYHIVAPTLRRH